MKFADIYNPLDDCTDAVGKANVLYAMSQPSLADMLEKTPKVPTYCPTCKKEATKPEDLLFVKACGECFMCDHLRSETKCE